MTKRDITLRDDKGSYRPEEGMRVTKEYTPATRKYNMGSKSTAGHTVVLTGSLRYNKNPGRWVAQWDNGFETVLKDGDRVCR